MGREEDSPSGVLHLHPPCLTGSGGCGVYPLSAALGHVAGSSSMPAYPSSLVLYLIRTAPSVPCLLPLLPPSSRVRAPCSESGRLSRCDAEPEKRVFGDLLEKKDQRKQRKTCCFPAREWLQDFSFLSKPLKGFATKRKIIHIM